MNPEGPSKDFPAACNPVREKKFLWSKLSLWNPLNDTVLISQGVN